MSASALGLSEIRNLSAPMRTPEESLAAIRKAMKETM
jgi:hypothetical protein